MIVKSRRKLQFFFTISWILFFFEDTKIPFVSFRGVSRSSFDVCVIWSLLFLVDYFIRQNEIRKKNVEYATTTRFHDERYENRFLMYQLWTYIFFVVSVVNYQASSLYTFALFVSLRFSLNFCGISFLLTTKLNTINIMTLFHFLIRHTKQLISSTQKLLSEAKFNVFLCFAPAWRFL
jgi:hypothetical protein